ncbi:EamA domain-containing protein [Balamuthia mandrillaris]
MIIGALSTLSGICLVFSNPHVPGVMQALLGPRVVTVPMAMGCSFLLLKSRYAWKQVGAMVLIMAGLFIALCPSFFGTGNRDTGNVGWNFCFLFGSLPLTIATVYQEKVFVDAPIHMAFMLAWICFYQLVAVFMTFAVDCIPGFGSSTFNNFVEHQTAALKCLFHGAVEHSHCPECHCDRAWLPMLLFIIAGILTNFAQLGVVKYGNATFLFIVSTLTLPLTEFAFALKFIMGEEETESISPYNYGALAVLLVGVTLYQAFDRSPLQKEAKGKEASVEMEEDRDGEKNPKEVMITSEEECVHLTALPVDVGRPKETYT